MNEITEWDIRELRQQGDLRALLVDLQAEAAARCAEQRALVLAHEDLAQQLTQPPMNFARPDCWTGYIPPEQCNGRHNESPIRAALVGIVTEALERRAS